MHGDAAVLMFYTACVPCHYMSLVCLLYVAGPRLIDLFCVVSPIYLQITAVSRQVEIMEIMILFNVIMSGYIISHNETLLNSKSNFLIQNAPTTAVCHFKSCLW